ncbi:DUF6531 domain-containing protein, partial [Lachnospiraceae bacterium OttesenSCG-928-D06]|nr:DUF6531 domain-containing protein [Lachnospiraceae bacterium OttesenSCG-928-D06]
MKALVEAPNAASAAAGVKMQCEVFYNNTSASYAPKLILSWTGELVDLENMSLDDTTIDIYPVVARNGDKSNNTLGVVAHGLAKAGSMVTYSLVNGSTLETEAATTLKYPDSSEYAGNYPGAIDYNRRLSNWQSKVFSGLIPGQVYYVTARASFEGETGSTVTSDTFIIYEEGAFDVLPRIANHYGVDLNTIMADMRMQDALTKQGNRIFIRNPKNTTAYEAGALDNYYKAMIDGLLLGRAENCEFGFDPINLNTGNYYLEYADAAIPDIGGDFALMRTYNSKGAGFKGSLGYGWNFTYDERLGELWDGSVLWLKNDGGILSFIKSGEGYTAPAGQNYDLVEFEDGYKINERETGIKHIFNAYGLLTGLEDIYGNRTTLSYDIEYRLFQITSPSGKIFGLTLDEQERITAVALPDGTTISYTYDDAGDLVTVTDQEGDIIHYQYDSNHYMSAYMDQNGNYVVRNTYDSEGRVLTQKDAEGNTITLEYQEGSTIATDNNGNVTVYHYDNSYRTTKVEYPDGTIIGKTYNSEGYLSTLTDEAGNTTHYSYDGRGNLLTETRADGAVCSYSYNDNNQLIKATDLGDGVTSYTYNENGLMTVVTDAEGGVTAYVYDELNRLTSVTDPEGGMTTFQYSGACVISMTDPEGNTWNYTYDAMNRLLTTKNPLGQISTNIYNKKGWVVKETNTAGAETIYTFDKAGAVIAITDAEGQTSTFTYNRKNEMLSGTDPLGNQLVYTYDANGNKLKETGGSGDSASMESITSYEYNNMDRVTKITNPNGYSTEYIYDTNGNLIFTRDRRSKITSAVFDTIKNVLVEETDKNGNKTTYETDILGRITKVVYADGSQIGYSYDNLSQITSITDQGGLVTQLSYDKNGNLIQIKDDNSRI